MEWTKIKDALPKINGKKVLLYCKFSGDFYAGELCWDLHDNLCWDFGLEVVDLHNFTHWMELPEEPNDLD